MLQKQVKHVKACIVVKQKGGTYKYEYIYVHIYIHARTHVDICEVQMQTLIMPTCAQYIRFIYKRMCMFMYIPMCFNHEGNQD